MKFSKIFSILFIVLVSFNVIFAQDETENVSHLLESSGNGDVESLIQAIDNGESLDVVNVNGWSAAMFAVGGGHIQNLRILIDNGIDLNIPTIDGQTPLMLAALNVSNFAYWIISWS